MVGDVEVLGIPVARFDATLVADLDNFAAAVVAAETGSGRIEPSHLLIALARIPGSVVSALFAMSGVPVEVFLDALRREADNAPGDLVTAFTQDTASPATREVFQDLAAQPEPGTIRERELIVALLPRLEPVAKTLLVDYGCADLEQWAAEAAAPPRVPVVIVTVDSTCWAR